MQIPAVIHPANPDTPHFDQSLLITAPVNPAFRRRRRRMIAYSVALHLLAGAGLYAASLVRIEKIEPPSLDRRDIVHPITIIHRPGLLGNRGAAKTVNPDKPKQSPKNVTPDQRPKLPDIVRPTVPNPVAADPEPTLSASANNPGIEGLIPGTPDGDPNGDPNSVGAGDPNAKFSGTELSTAGIPTYNEYKISEPAVAIRRVDPKYPESARSAGLEATVIVEAIVDENGRVVAARIIRSDNAIFDQNALAAVRQWEFTSAKLDGRVVRTYKTITLRFKLR